MQDLKLSLIQSVTHWHDIQANLDMFEAKISGLPDTTDVIVLPEMFSTGFTMDTNLAEEMDGPSVSWMQRMASQTNTAVTGSIIASENGSVFNRMIWATPDGEINTYDKRHLFRMADEHNYFDFGTERTIVQWKGWNILLQVCYDLRFPVWSRNRNMEYDALIYVANWPAVRVSAWDALLKARAIENLSYCVGLNRVGVDGKELKYNGHSGVYGPKGEILAFSDQEEVITVILDGKELLRYREKFPAHLDADDFKI